MLRRYAFDRFNTKWHDAPMASSDTSQSDLTRLEAELQDLRKFKQDFEKRDHAKSKIQMFLMKLWVGPELSKSIEDWMNVKGENNPQQTISASANVLAAIFRRLMRVSFVFILVALIPIILIIWQNIIMERQNQSLIAQIKAERTASSNQQVTEYLRLLLSNDKRQVAAAEGFLVSDLVNRDIAVERLAALIQSGNSDVQCSALGALTGIIKYPSELTLKSVIAPQNSDRLILRDLQCENIDFQGVDFGPITFVDVGLPNSDFGFSDVSQVEFETSNLRHSDFSDTQLCKDYNRCISFQDVDLSYANMNFTNRSKDVFRNDLVLQGAQLEFNRHVLDKSENVRVSGRAEDIKQTKLAVPKISNESIIASGVCYESTFSQCFLFHKAKDLGKLSSQKLESLRQFNCPINLDGPIVLTSESSCENLGLQRRW